MDREEWWLDHSNLCALVRWLIDRDELPLEEVAYFLEKPWKWDTEWRQMCGQPPTTARAVVRGDRVLGVVEGGKS